MSIQIDPQLIQVIAPAPIANEPDWIVWISGLLVSGLTLWVAWRQAGIARQQTAIAPSQAEIATKQAESADRQAETARNKLKLDLYDKRMEVCHTVRDALGAAVRGEVTRDEELAFLSGVRNAKWLFGHEVAAYLEDTLWGKVIDLGLHNAMSGSPYEPERSTHIEKRAETMKWLMHQHEAFDAMVGPFMTLAH